MAVLKPRKELPDVGELVVGTVKEVYDYGAYLVLDEYQGIEAYLPWSEVASRWIRSIHEAVKPGQKVVVKVIRVNKPRKQVDVSLKRVTDGERRRKMMEWKRAQKAAKILEMVSEKLGVPFDKMCEDVAWKLEDYYGEVMEGLEQAVLRGPQALVEAGVPENIAQALYEEARRHIEIKKVKIVGVLTLRSLAKDGIRRIKELLRLATAKAKQHEGVDIRIYTVGAPRYRMEVIANDYKDAERVLREILEAVESKAKELEVEYSFSRIKE